jgi:tRNA A-37 threonylcarbamoyl transferase component Bud32
MKYPRQLSYGANNKVVVLTDTLVAKIFEGDTRSDLGSEAEKMKFANQINDLVTKFIRLDYDDEKKWDMLVMERIYPLDFRSIEVEKRELIFSVFDDELTKLHQNGFVHRDICRPSSQSGEKYDNVLLTNEGLRLIDVGISALKHQVGDKIFEKYLEIEREEMAIFKNYFLNR